MLSQFPIFTPLTIDERASYDKIATQFPPFSDLSFTTLQIWWNLDDQLSAALLDGNLVINYNLPFDDENSGYCLVGDRNIAANAERIFDYLRSQDKPCRLVHVPEFVAKHLQHPDRYTLHTERDYDEYILDSQALAKLEGSDHGRSRRRIARFQRELIGRTIETRELDLSVNTFKQELFVAIVTWEEAHPRANDPEHTERQAIRKTLELAADSNIHNLGLYIDESLAGIVLYQTSHDKQYFILDHIKVDYGFRYSFDYMTHIIAGKAVQENVPFLNMEMDLGIENLREHKMGLRPVDFFRKFTVKRVD